MKHSDQSLKWPCVEHIAVYYISLNLVNTRLINWDIFKIGVLILFVWMFTVTVSQRKNVKCINFNGINTSFSLKLSCSLESEASILKINPQILIMYWTFSPTHILLPYTNYSDKKIGYPRFSYEALKSLRSVSWASSLNSLSPYFNIWLFVF